MTRTYYKVENGKVVGWQGGTDIKDDATSTKASLEAWVAEKPSERALVETEEALPAENVVLENGQVRPATEEEIAQRETEEKDAAQAKADARKAAAKLLQKKLGLTDEEMELILNP